MPAAVIPALIAAGGAVGAAAISSHAASQASEQEQQANTAALALTTQMYNQSRQDYAPYRALGASALPQLAAYASSPVINKGGSQGYRPGYLPGVTMSPTGTSGLVAPPRTLGGLAQAAGPLNGGAMGGPEPLVALADDTGQVRHVPESQAQRYIAMGAKVVQPAGYGMNNPLRGGTA